MSYFRIVSLLPPAEGDQRRRFLEKEGELTAPKVSIVLLHMGPAKNIFLACISSTGPYILLGVCVCVCVF